MKLLNQTFIGMSGSLRRALVISSLAGLALQAGAQIQTIDHLNSGMEYDPATGAVDWTVDGVNQLNQQSFHYRVGSSGPEQNVSNIDSTPSIIKNEARHLDVLYANSQLSVDALYYLTGNYAGSGLSGLNLTLTIKNLSATTLDLHFFQYADFNLGGVAGGQTNRIFMQGSRYNRVGQYYGTSVLNNTLSSGLMPATRVEAALAGVTLASLTDGNPTLLGNTLAAGLGDVTYAIQWDYVLQAAGVAGDSLQISQLISLQVPEPSSVALIGTGLLAAALLRRSRKTV